MDVCKHGVEVGCGICSGAWDLRVRTREATAARFGRRVWREGRGWVWSAVRGEVDVVRSHPDLVSWFVPADRLIPDRLVPALRSVSPPGEGAAGESFDQHDVTQRGIGPLVGVDYGGYRLEVGREDFEVGVPDRVAAFDLWRGRSASDCEGIMSVLVAASLRSDTFTVREYVAPVRRVTLAAMVIGHHPEQVRNQVRVWRRATRRVGGIPRGGLALL